MKKAAAFSASTPSFIPIRIGIVLTIILLYLIPLAFASRLLSGKDVHLQGTFLSLAGQAVARNLGGVGGSPFRGDGSHHGN
ncbi:hypothetical protein CDL15_Pgr028795 [Punica granatum]|uniref:Uncharacterized protein n=1 Tax=Punica granatum TaxID=22663 RepID=A0A218VWW6_PUNGR|nr:hypothetical protein CDL15_Pgr028795 [Punica granatum]